ncbi:MAG: UvrD-helicase domain-containing protein, partial [bacterium]
GHEMKQRLNISLHEALEQAKSPSLRQHINAQILALPQAYITTFHSFCKSLLDRYGFLVDVTPGFTINAAPAYMQDMVLEACLQKWIVDDRFTAFCQRFNDRQDFSKIKELILKLYVTTSSYVDFTAFLNEIKDTYYQESAFTGTLLDDLIVLMKRAYQQTISRFDLLASYCDDNRITPFFEAPENARKKGTPCPFDAYAEYLSSVDAILNIGQPTYEDLAGILSIKVPKPSSISWKKEGISSEVKDGYTALKNTMLDPLTNLEPLLHYPKETLQEIMNLSLIDLVYLLGEDGLVNQFEADYRQLKQAHNQLDFHDLEVYAKKLLSSDYPVIATLNHRLREIMVDEYQDTNQIQEDMITTIAHYDKEIPIFMVGDMKQSIYRFRQADPSIFTEKFNTFTPLEEAAEHQKNVRIDLRYNYRSQKAVLDSINYIFDCIMDTQVGGLEYYHEPSALLRYDFEAKNTTPALLEVTDAYDTDVLLGIMDDYRDMDTAEVEAHMIAQHILKLKEQGASFKDFAILFRSSTEFITFKIIFDQYQIPANIALSGGLMNTNEVRSMMMLLEALVHPHHDIAMISVLYNGFVISHFDANELLALRDENHTVMENLQASSDERVVAFLKVYQELRSFSLSHTPYETLIECLRVTDFNAYLAMLPHGEQRIANIEALAEVFYANQDYPDLEDYLNYLNLVDNAPGVIASDHSDAITFMTIHKSKGLQFKYVYVASLQKAFNTQDERESIIIDRQKGIAGKLHQLKEVDDYGEMLIDYNNPYRNMIALYMHKDMIDEEMRILYVALTRAEDKLILSGVLRSHNDLVKLAQEVLANEHDSTLNARDTVVFNENLRMKNNYLMWIMSALMRKPSIQETLTRYAGEFGILSRLRRNGFKGLDHEETALSRFHLMIEKAETIVARRSYNQEAHQLDHYDRYAPYYTYQYPYSPKDRSIAVTTLQALEDEERYTFVEGQASSRSQALALGTLVHEVLSHLTFKEDHLNVLIDKLKQGGLLHDEELTILQNYRPHLDAFLASPTYDLIKRASVIYREKPFRYQEADRVINGIFDLVFITDGQVYVLDYKTDQIKDTRNLDALRDKHRLQLEYYKRVLKAHYHQDVQAIVYYLETSQAIII